MQLDQFAGGWALVTGASSGIGKSFAMEFARRGLNVVLVARSEARLRAVADQIEAIGGRAHVATADLSTPGAAGVLATSLAQEGITVDVLVNNAGRGGYGALETQDGPELAASIQLNCTAPVELAHALLPSMKRRQRGAIVFVSSIQAELSLPYFATYAATKAFQNTLAEALHGELRGTGVHVLSVMPGITATEFFDANAIDGEFPLFPVRQPEQVVDTALAALGRKLKVTDGWDNAAVVALMGALPRKWLVAINARLTDPASQKEEVKQAHAKRSRDSLHPPSP